MKTITTHKTVVAAVAVVAALALPMVVGAADTNASKLVVKDSTGVTDRMVVTDMGRIGVGTSVPAAGLDIQSTSYNTSQIKSQQTTTINYEGPSVGLFRNNPNGGTDKLPIAGDRIGSVLMGTMIGSTPRNAVGIYGYAGGTTGVAWTSASSPAYIAFETTDVDQSIRYERVRISQNGNLGVGLTSPSQKIEVNGGIRYNTQTARPTCSSTTRGTTWFVTGGTGVADTFSICVKDASENYSWKSLF